MKEEKQSCILPLLFDSCNVRFGLRWILNKNRGYKVLYVSLFSVVIYSKRGLYERSYIFVLIPDHHIYTMLYSLLVGKWFCHYQTVRDPLL